MPPTLPTPPDDASTDALGTVSAVPKSQSTPAKGAPKKKRGRLFRFVTATLVLIGLAGYAVHHFTTSTPQQPGCTVTAEGRTLTLEPQQAANASTIAAVASSRDLPERAVTIALATSMQESGLRNLDHGDRDSRGLFQQRPSQGWGTAAQIMDPVHASNEFFDGLVKIRGYSRLPLTVAAQKVQKSGFPQAYAKHEPDATLLASALTGRVSAALSCTTASGRTTVTGGDPAAVRARLTREFGSRVAPKALATTTHAVAVPSAAPGNETQGAEQQRGWELAQWAVAHAHELKVEKVSFRDREWQASDSAKGWQKASTGTGSVTAAGDVTITVAQ